MGSTYCQCLFTQFGVYILWEWNRAGLDLVISSNQRAPRGETVAVAAVVLYRAPMNRMHKLGFQELGF